MKLVHPHFSVDEDFRKRFRRRVTYTLESAGRLRFASPSEVAGRPTADLTRTGE